MKWSNIKHLTIVFVLLLSVCLPTLYAQQDTLATPSLTPYEKRLEKYQRRWNNLIPRYAKMQYAGSMGFVSLGIGWDYGRNKQWETDFIIGYLPKFNSSDNKLTFTIKQNYMPWKVTLGKPSKGFFLEPLACGAYLNTMFGHNFWSKEPDRNAGGYYTFATKVRFNIYVGQRITYQIKRNKRFFDKSITFFYELSSNDIYIAQAFNNSYLKPKDYIHLSFGLKFQFL